MFKNSNALLSKLNQTYKWQILIFFTVLISIGVVKFFIPGLVPFGPDEVGTIAGAAFFAGLDWGSVISLTGYYGFGFTIFLFPVFLFDLSPYIILVIMRFANTVLTAFGGIIVYRIMTDIFGVEDKKLVVVVSIATACFGYNAILTNAVVNDTALIFLNWIVLYILLLMVNRIELRKRNTIQSLYLSFVMCYGFLIHTRIIIIWGGVFVFLICYFIMSRKILVDIKVFLTSFLLLFFLSHSLTRHVQDVLWMANDRAIVNSVEFLGYMFSPSTFLNLLSIGGLIAFTRMIVGELHSTFVQTGGIAPLLFVSLAFCIICLVRKKTRAQSKTFIEENKYLFLAAIYTISQIAAMIFLTALSQILNIHINADVRWLIYTRYWSVVAAPTIVLSTILLHNAKKELTNKLIKVSAITIVVINILFAYLVAPLFNGVDIVQAIHYFSFFAGMALGNVVRPIHFFIVTIFSGAVTLIIYSCAKKRKLVPISVVFVAYSLYSFYYFTVGFHIPQSQDLTVERHVVDLFNDADISPIEYPTIHAGFDGWTLQFLGLQFYLYRHSVVPIEQHVYFPFTNPAQIPIYLSNSVDLDSVSFNMFFGSDHKKVDFGVNDEDVPIGANRHVLINADETDLLTRIEAVGYGLSTFDTLAFSPINRLHFYRANRRMISWRMEDHMRMISWQMEDQLFDTQPFLAPGDIQFGPYVHLPAGRYDVIITGHGLFGASFSATHSVGESIEIYDFFKTDNMVTYSFTLENSKENIEFIAANNSSNIVGIENIQLRITQRLPSNRVDFEEPIRFNARNRNYYKFYMSGLSEQERRGVWSSGHKTEFMFHIPDVIDDLVFSFTAEPLGLQLIELEANGTSLGFLEITQLGTYEVLIPASLITENRLHLAFILPTAITPRELDINEDERVLALFFEEMMFVENPK